MSASIHVEESVQIAKPPGEVWDAIADYSFERSERQLAAHDDGGDC